MTRHDMITHGYRISAAGGKAHEESLGAAMLNAARREGHMALLPSLRQEGTGSHATDETHKRRMTVLRLAKAGLFNIEIAKKLKVRHGCVLDDRKWLLTNGYKLPPSPRKKGPEICKVQLRRLYEAGLTDAEIAEHMGHSKPTIANARRRMGLMRKVMA